MLTHSILLFALESKYRRNADALCCAEGDYKTMSTARYFSILVQRKGDSQ
jgi:hypothetical protein